MIKPVHWTDRAKARLRNIETYLNTHAGSEIAQQEVGKILKRSAQLSKPPDIGHKVEGYEESRLREVLIRPYRIIYLPKTTQIDVITVMRYGRLFQMDLDEFSETQH